MKKRVSARQMFWMCFIFKSQSRAHIRFYSTLASALNSFLLKLSFSVILFLPGFFLLCLLSFFLPILVFLPFVIFACVTCCLFCPWLFSPVFPLLYCVNRLCQPLSVSGHLQMVSASPLCFGWSWVFWGAFFTPTLLLEDYLCFGNKQLLPHLVFLFTPHDCFIRNRNHFSEWICIRYFSVCAIPFIFSFTLAQL